jgi:hypothetical protein
MSKRKPITVPPFPLPPAGEGRGEGTSTLRVLLMAATVCALLLLFGHGAAAQFSNRDGYAPDGPYRVQVELTPYLWLPALDATIGLRRPPGVDVSINRPRPTVSDLVAHLDGAFVGDALVRYGPRSAELDADWVTASLNKTFPALVNVPQAELKTRNTLTFVSSGFGYRVIPNFAPDKVSFDVRAGLSYFDASTSVAFLQSRLGGVNVAYSFVVPWLGFRADYYPTPHWRLDLTSALTGLGADSVWGWNTKLAVSYLITRWFDVSLGFAALATNHDVSLRPDGRVRSLHAIAYGPVVAVGFRF